MHKRPEIAAEVFTEFEHFGFEPMKILLMDYSGTNRDDLLTIGKIQARRGDIHDWLKWKAQVDQMWTRTGVIAALLAAMFSLVSCLHPH